MKVNLKSVFLASMCAMSISSFAQTAYTPAVGIDDAGHYRWRATGNPIITHKHSADPAPVVKGDTLWLYTGCDYAGNQGGYKMHEWNLYSTTDMVNWTEHPSPLHVDEFKWQNSRAAYAGHVIERNGKWYFYVSTNWCGIGVAVADNPRGPFKDALGTQLLTNANCPGTTHSWACIDPFVMIDDDGQAWISWGNGKCFIAKLKENMIEIDGEVKEIPLKGTKFTEAPWIHKHNGKYYLTFAEGWPEKIGYAVSDKIDGPYEYKGVLSEVAGNSNTTHPGVVNFLGKDWFFTHNGALPQGTSYSRSVCVQPLEYEMNGDLKKCDIVSNPEFLTAPVAVGSPAQLTELGIPLSVQPKTEAYLFAYFEGRGDNMKQEQIRFAISENGRDWKALNGNNPVLDSDVISNTGGVRDPHIMRGADGKSYYMVATDMFTHKTGWGFNPGIVLMRSENLTDWTHSAIDFTKVYPEKFGDVQWVWAPQTFYDVNEGKYLVYFTVKFKHNGYLDYYCAYANKDFTALEHEPVFMFRADHGAIDGDIIYNANNGLYHFFFKGNTKDNNGREYINGIKQAVGRSPYGPWYEDRTYIDAYAGRIAVEGSGIFKLNPKDSKNGKDEYILMYDLYHNGRYEFQRTNDLIHFTSQPESFTKDFFPRHGTVMPITKKELKRLKAKWGE